MNGEQESRGTKLDNHDDDDDDGDNDDRLHQDVILLLRKQKPMTSQCKRLHDQEGKVKPEKTAYRNNFKELS